MKRTQWAVLAGLLTSLWSLSALAQAVPQTISFTGNLRDASGPVTGPHTFVFTLYDTGGTAVWTETMNALVVNNGIVTVDLGKVKPLDGTVFSGSQLFLEVTVDSQPLTPRSAIQSVPYAIRAGVAGTLSMTCPAGQVLKAGASGALACADAVATGPGLVGNGSPGSPLAPDFAGTGSAGTVARSDHTHTATLTCRKALSMGAYDAFHDQVGCDVGEVLTGGGCIANGTGAAIVENAQYVCTGITCIKTCTIVTGFCRGSGNWVCSATNSTSVQASAICCKPTVN